MPRFALLGNCQIHSLAAVLPLMVDEAEIQYLDYSSPASRDELNRRDFADTLTDCDWILTQPTHLSHTSDLELRKRFPGKTCVFGNFYFRGLFPDSCYIGGFGRRMERPSAVHSVIILDAFLSGLPPELAAKSFTIDNYEKLGLLDAWTSSMAEMRRRDTESAIDVPAADLMEEACRSYPAFLTMNHPTIGFLADYLAQVLAKLGVKHRRVDASRIPDPLAIHDTTPIDDVIAEHFELPYRVTQRWMLDSLGKRFLDKDEIAFRFYGAYAKAPRDALMVNSPTDLVKRYGADPAFRYLVDGTDAHPSERSVARRSWAPSRSDVERYALMEAVDTVAVIETYIHKMHSFGEVNDPKVERLVHQLTVRRDIPNDLQYLTDQSRHTLRALWLIKRLAVVQAALTVLVVAALCGIAVVAHAHGILPLP